VTRHGLLLPAITTPSFLRCVPGVAAAICQLQILLGRPHFYLSEDPGFGGRIRRRVTENVLSACLFGDPVEGVFHRFVRCSVMDIASSRAGVGTQGSIGAKAGIGGGHRKNLNVVLQQNFRVVFEKSEVRGFSMG